MLLRNLQGGHFLLDTVPTYAATRHPWLE